MIILLWMLVIGLTNLELVVFNIESIGESIYYCVVTMTTVGYGDISPSTYTGKWLMSIATFLGVIFEGILLVAWAKAISMN